MGTLEKHPAMRTLICEIKGGIFLAPDCTPNLPKQNPGPQLIRGNNNGNILGRK